jgi:hypothetical protein
MESEGVALYRPDVPSRRSIEQQVENGALLIPYRAKEKQPTR